MLFFRLLLSVLFLVVLPLRTQAQIATIEGYVYDAESKEPIIGANVFINNSTIGAATSVEGYYKIEKVPLGKFEIVATYISHYSQSLEVDISSQGAYKADFILAEDVRELSAITIRGSNAQWKRSLGFFKKYFLGTSFFARKCSIRNPEVLDFDFDSETFVTTTVCFDDLIIDNESLGYTIYYTLDHFEWDNVDYKLMMGKARFEPKQPENDKIAQRWKRNRLKAYTGSSQEFFEGLAGEGLKDRGFRIYRLQNLPEIGVDEPRYEVYLDSVMTPVPAYDAFKLSFDDYLEVVYDLEPEPAAYQKYKGQSYRGDRIKLAEYRPSTQVSVLEMRSDSIVFDNGGYVFNPRAFKVYGFWAWERMADLMPIDYVPDKSSL